MSLFSAARRDYEFNARNERLEGENLERWKQRRRCDDKALPRLLLSPHKVLAPEDIKTAVRLVDTRTMKRSQWWTALSTRVDTREDAVRAPAEGTVYAAGCSIEHEDRLRANDACLMLDTPALGVLEQPGPLFLHQILSGSASKRSFDGSVILQTKRVACCRVVWSAQRRDSMSAWIMLAVVPESS